MKAQKVSKHLGSYTNANRVKKNHRTKQQKWVWVQSLRWKSNIELRPSRALLPLV